MENREIAAIFEEISNLMKILQDYSKWTFKAAAYDRAKRSIESYHERLADIARNPNRKLSLDAHKLDCKRIVNRMPCDINLLYGDHGCGGDGDDRYRHLRSSQNLRRGTWQRHRNHHG